MKSLQSTTFEWVLAWPIWVAALWWGSLTTLAFAVVPLLFAYLPSAALAGNTAARLFGVQAMATAVFGLLLLLATRLDARPELAARAQSASAYVLAGALLALLVEFGVAPRIVTRDNLPLWHGLGTGMLALQWLCASVTFWRMARPLGRPQVQV